MNRYTIFFLLILVTGSSRADSLLQLQKPLILPDTSVSKTKVFKAGISSAILPGAGQFLQKRYFMAGTFLAFEAVSGAVAYHYYDKKDYWLDMADKHSSEALSCTGFVSLSLKEQSFLAEHSSRISNYRIYNALGWIVGGYIYNILDAAGGVSLQNSEPKDPVKAGWLAAIPGLGLGQIYNGKLSKAGLFIMGQVSLAVMAANNHRLMTSAEREKSRLLDLRNQSEAGLQVYEKYRRDWDSQRNSAFRKRNTYLWYSLIVYFVNVFDAIVDAHLSDYDQKMKVYPDLTPHNRGARLNLNVNF